MLDLCFDPYFLSCPDPSAGPTAIDLYVDRLLAWRDFAVDDDAVSLFTSHSASTVLVRTGTYPARELLDSVIARLPQPYFSVTDIYRVAQRFLHHYPLLEESLGLDDILIDNVSLEPSTYLALRPDPFIYPHQLALALLCLLKTNRPGPKALVTCDIEESTKVHVSADVALCEPSPTSTASAIPSTIQGDCLTCSAPESLSLSLDALDLWLTATTDSQYQYALHTYLVQTAAGLGRPVSDERLSCWRFGSSFLETARSIGFTVDSKKAGSLLRVCAQALLVPEAGTAEHVDKKRGSSKQKARPSDGALGWRRYIGHDYRLNYWQNGNLVEFAQVEPKLPTATINIPE